MINKTSYNILRKNISPYQGEFFCINEKKSLEQISAVSYESKNQSLDKILITNTHTRLDLLSKAELSNTKLMIHPNSGYDNFNVNFVKSANFPIIIGNSIRAHAVSNYILSCLFSHLSPVPQHKEWDKERLWNRGLLNKKNVLIIGYGTIGKILESSLSNLVKKISIYDPYKEHSSIGKNIDVLIMACSLTPSSHNIINENILDNLSDDYLFINGARGKLVNEQHLISSLSNRPKAYAYLDVFQQEPCNFDKWKSLQNVAISSHIAGVFEGLNESIISFEKEVISDFIAYENDIAIFRDKYKDMLLQNRIIEDFLI